MPFFHSSLHVFTYISWIMLSFRNVSGKREQDIGDRVSRIIAEEPKMPTVTRIWMMLPKWTSHTKLAGPVPFCIIHVCRPSPFQKRHLNPSRVPYIDIYLHTTCPRSIYFRASEGLDLRKIEMDMHVPRVLHDWLLQREFAAANAGRLNSFYKFLFYRSLVRTLAGISRPRSC